MDKLDELLKKFSDHENADLYLHAGPVEAPADKIIIDAVSVRPRKTKAVLLLCTYGGIPDVAYRMMRALQHGYDEVRIVVAGPCKSAGTLMAIGAHSLAMEGHAELGPLDIQVLKKDEILERQSGLEPAISIGSLSEQAKSTFVKFYLEMKVNGRMTTATAAQTSANLTVGLFAPIFGQVNPMRVGEVTRANFIGRSYAVALRAVGKNIEQQGIDKLLFDYPSHSYVIDRTEAMELFTDVSRPSEAERSIIDAVGEILLAPPPTGITVRLTAPEKTPLEDSSYDETPDGSDSTGESSTDRPSETAGLGPDLQEPGEDEGGDRRNRGKNRKGG